jgi:glycosyltransferase involved in cell wall biosynthesis
VAAVPEIVEDGRTGLLVGPRNPEELAMAIERVLGDARLRATLGAAAYERVGAFDLTRVATRFVEACGA